MITDLVKKVFERTDLSPEPSMSISDMKHISARLDKEMSYKTIDAYRITPKEDGIISISVHKGNRSRTFSLYPENVTIDPAYFIMREMEFFHLDSGVDLAIKRLSQCKELYSFRVKGDSENNTIVIRYELHPGTILMQVIPNDDRLEHCLELFCEDLK